jgi:hypothetical protein
MPVRRLRACHLAYDPLTSRGTGRRGRRGLRRRDVVRPRRSREIDRYAVSGVHINMPRLRDHTVAFSPLRADIVDVRLAGSERR